MNKDKVKIENYLSLYQLTKYNHSINDIECELEALKQYLEERIMCNMMCNNDNDES